MDEKDTELEVAFRRRLYVLRRESGLSQVQLAQRIGRGQEHVSRYETGGVHLRLVDSVRIVEALDADPSSVVAGVLADAETRDGGVR